MHTSQSPEAKLSMEKAHLISFILQFEMPKQVFAESMESAVKAVATREIAPSAVTAPIRARRAALEAMALEDLRGLHAAAVAQKAKQDEAQRFYNKREAMADFGYWLSMDFWTLDEAMALLSQRDPRVVNRFTIEDHLAPKKGLLSGPRNQPTAFTKFFLTLSHLAERSNAMTHSPRLTPVEVIRWAKGVMGPQVPTQLLAYLDGQPALPPTEEARQEPPAAAAATRPADELRKTKVKRAALMQLENVWPTVVNDLQHANRNGLAEAAKSTEFGLWWEEAALHWARVNGRLDKAPSGSPLLDLPRRVNRLQ